MKLKDIVLLTHGIDGQTITQKGDDLIKILKHLTGRCLCIVLILMMSFIFAGPIPYHADYDVGVRTIYLDNGNNIDCRRTWIYDDQIFCQKYNGTLGFPLSQINVGKTFRDIATESGDKKTRVLREIRKYRNIK